MTTLSLALPARPAPAWPLHAAWSALIRRRAVWVVVAAWLAQAIGFGIGMNYVFYRQVAADPAQADTAATWRAGLLTGALDTFAAGSLTFYGTAMAVVLGALVIGSEYTSRTVTLLYTQGPGRVATLGAQLVALTGLLGVMTALTFAADYAGLAVIAGIEGWPVTAPAAGATAVSFLTAWLTATAYGLVGATLALVTRNAVGALAVGLVWTLAAENALVLIAGQVAVLKPLTHVTLSVAASNLAIARGCDPWWPISAYTEVTARQGWLAAGVLAAWCAAAVAVALSLIRRRDI
jgi:ABC-type transport system involved in multi-copper enzyme maturation permease subunit